MTLEKNSMLVEYKVPNSQKVNNNTKPENTKRTGDDTIPLIT